MSSDLKRIYQSNRDKLSIASISPESFFAMSAFLIPTLTIAYISLIYLSRANLLALLIPCMKMILRADQHPCRDVAAKVLHPDSYLHSATLIYLVLGGYDTSKTGDRDRAKP